MAAPPPPPAEAVAQVRMDLERESCSLAAAVDRLTPLLPALPTLTADDAHKLATLLIAKSTQEGPRHASAAQALDAALVLGGVAGVHLKTKGPDSDALAAAVCRAARRPPSTSCRDAFVVGKELTQQGGRAADRLAASTELVTRAAAAFAKAASTPVSKPEAKQKRRLGPQRQKPAPSSTSSPCEALSALDFVKAIARHAPDSLLRRWPGPLTAGKDRVSGALGRPHFPCIITTEGLRVSGGAGAGPGGCSGGLRRRSVESVEVRGQRLRPRGPRFHRCSV